jgi:hypothetical protein
VCFVIRSRTGKHRKKLSGYLKVVEPKIFCSHQEYQDEVVSLHARKADGGMEVVPLILKLDTRGDSVVKVQKPTTGPFTEPHEYSPHRHTYISTYIQTHTNTHTNTKYFCKFNVFHVRALYFTKTLITNKCTKRVLSSIVTHCYMFRPCWVIFRENFCYRYTKVAFYSWVRMCCWLCTALFLEAWTLCGHSTIKCNLSVTMTKSSPSRWPSRVETCRSVLRLMIKLFVHLLVASVFILL